MERKWKLLADNAPDAPAALPRVFLRHDIYTEIYISWPTKNLLDLKKIKTKKSSLNSEALYTTLTMQNIESSLLRECITTAKK